MSVIEEIQALVVRSRLFANPEKLAKLKKDEANGKKIRGKRLRELVKIGQGGTLDPLADGVLVVGVGKGTKQLQQFLDCTKEYKATCLLGCETDTYDSEGSIVRRAPWKHVTPEDIKSKLGELTGKIQQTPPIFSALKMDGRPLYEYARQGIPLPRPIEPREVTVHHLEMTEWLGTDHNFQWPEKEFDEAAKKKLADAISTNAEEFTSEEAETAEMNSGAAFVLKMTVSGGTYVRSIVHDLAHNLGSAGHVVTLTRTRQGKYTLEPGSAEDLECVSWEVFQQAKSNSTGAEGWADWEEEVMKKMEIVS